MDMGPGHRTPQLGAVTGIGSFVTISKLIGLNDRDELVGVGLVDINTLETGAVQLRPNE